MHKLYIEKGLDEIYIEILAKEINKGTRSLYRLPSFQRDAVWKNSQIELLWDSIMRGFPIGVLLFSKLLKDLGTRTSQTDSEQQANDNTVDFTPSKDSYIIIDGQQRSIAIALGFRKYITNDSARLWLDISPKNKSDAIQFNFSMCTLANPWGNVPYLDKLESMALEAIGKDKHKRPNDKNILEYSYPLKADYPVPFEYLLNIKKKFDVNDLLPIGYFPTLNKKFNDNRIELIEKIELLRPKINAIRQFKIPLYLIDGIQDISDLGNVFQRLNSGGIVMSAEELFYSALKLRWYKCHNIVWDIYKNQAAGKFLSQINIIHLAVRLAVISLKEDNDIKRSDVVRLNQRSFKSIISYVDKDDKSLLKKIQEHFGQGQSDNKILSSIIKAKEALSYNCEKYGEDDIGLPTPLLASLYWRIWHTICAWTYNNELDDNSRREIVRYALFEHFYLHNTDSNDIITRETFKLAFAEKRIFPGKQIYEKIKDITKINENESNFKILNPDEFIKCFIDERGNPKDSKFNNPNYVLWIQRHFIYKWWPEYDPSQFNNRREDLPYDLDHIVAGAFFNMRGGIPNSEKFRLYPEKFHKYRYIALNRFGNYRFWPKELNRSDQDKGIADKLLLGDDSTKIDFNHYKNLNLKTIGDIRKASYFHNFKSWESIPKDKYKWWLKKVVVENAEKEEFDTDTGG